MESESIENNILSTSEERFIKKLRDFLEEVKENRFKFNKELFLDYFIKKTEMEKRFCKKYDINKAQNMIEKLPEEIKLIPLEYLKKYGEEESEIKRMIKIIIFHCEIHSKFSITDILKCSKAITLLEKATYTAIIENTDILIYSFPELNQIILAKLIFQENNKYLDKINEEEIQCIVTIEKSYFCASKPFLKLYFQLFDENDPKIEEYFKELNKIKK